LESSLLILLYLIKKCKKCDSEKYFIIIIILLESGADRGLFAPKSAKMGTLILLC